MVSPVYLMPEVTFMYSCIPECLGGVVARPCKSLLALPRRCNSTSLQTGCMVIVLAPVVEAARPPRVCPMALGYGLPPLDDKSKHGQQEETDLQQGRGRRGS